jgi:hypothetical protein
MSIIAHKLALLFADRSITVTFFTQHRHLPILLFRFIFLNVYVLELNLSIAFVILYLFCEKVGRLVFRFWCNEVF